MKKLIFKILFLTLVVFVPVSAMAGVSVRVNIPLPPPIIFPAPPQVAVIPGTNVYAVPDVKDDIFFYGGWWWRSWEGRWYRSHYYDRGWVYYKHLHLFTDMFFPGGEIITGITGGIGYIIRKLYAIGGHGKEPGTGNVCMEYRPNLGLHPLLGNLSCRIINRI
jgi:hypothetical protein